MSSTSSSPRLFVVTGPDGSGKSTACARARALLSERGLSVAEVSVWDCLRQESGCLKPAFDSPREAARYLADLDGTSRTLFIFHAMARALQLAQRSPAQALLVSGYWFKYAVSEIGYGVDPEFVLGAAQGFAPAHHVFCLDIDPETAWERRQGATSYEQGGASARGSERERFIGFQTRLRQAWHGIEAQSGQHWEHLSALDPMESVAQQIVDGVLLRLGPQAGGVAR